jgi:hypothetical protein
LAIAQWLMKSAKCQLAFAQREQVNDSGRHSVFDGEQQQQFTRE